MTTPELITNEIVAKALNKLPEHGKVFQYHMKAAILAIQDDITRPWINAMQGYKRDAEAYENGLRMASDEMDRERRKRPFNRFDDELYSILDKTLKGKYHKTDFTEYCKQNPITEE